VSKYQRYHRDEGRQRNACVDGEHDHRRTVRFEHHRQGDTKVAFEQVNIKGYCRWKIQHRPVY
jgi:hypothetical protein